jgi:Fuc2NAc and GlcNAc transferase
MSSLMALAAGAAVASAALTGLLRATVAREMLDHPNERSSHSRSVPRGGGAAIVLVTLAVVVWGLLEGRIPERQGIALLGGGASIALLGWLDDRSSLSARLRLVVQVLAAAWTVAWLGGFAELDLGARHARLGTLGSVLAVLAIVWATNLFNFMDGIDGLAGSEALLLGGFGAWFLAGTAASPLAGVAAACAGGALGFLLWNWHPARIFMGDVGSAFLGYLFASLAIAGERAGGPPALIWVLLAGVFVFDATVTLLRRLRRGYWSEAHRTHAYQRAVQAGWSHARVSGAVVMLNITIGLSALQLARHPQRLLPALLACGLLLAVVYVAVGHHVPFPPLVRRPWRARPDTP